MAKVTDQKRRVRNCFFEVFGTEIYNAENSIPGLGICVDVLSRTCAQVWGYVFLPTTSNRAKAGNTPHIGAERGIHTNPRYPRLRGQSRFGEVQQCECSLNVLLKVDLEAPERCKPNF